MEVTLIKEVILGVAIASTLTFALPAEAKRRVDAFNGLTPKDYVVQNAQTQLNAVELSDAKVAIIPSQNFLNYMNDMRKWFRPEKFRNLFGERPTDQNMNFLVHASEPQILTDRLVEKLTALGATPVIANSLPDAQSQGATIFVIFDYHGKMKDLSGIGGFIPFTKEKTGWESTGGIHVLDSNLQRKLKIEATAMDEYRDSTFLPGMNEQALKWATIISGSQKLFLDQLFVQWDATVR